MQCTMEVDNGHGKRLGLKQGKGRHYFFREIDSFCRFEMEGFEVLTNISYNYNTYKPVIIWDIYQVPVVYK